MLYEMLAGHRAFNGQTASATVSAVLTSEPDWRSLPSSTPPSITALLRRCLAKEPEKRLSHVTAAKEILANSLVGSIDETAATSAPSVAVLPFISISGDAENQYFCDGLSEELINALTRIPDLKVACRTSAFRFRGVDQDVRRIGDELGVSSIVEGSVRRAGPRLRVAVQLIDVNEGYERWSERYDRQMADVFDIQDDIVSSVVAALVPALRSRHRVHRATDNLRAYEIYLKGLHFLHQRSPSTLQVAIQSFEQAIALDPEYVLAFTGLADCYTLLCGYGVASPDEVGPRASAAIDRALLLNPSLPEVHFSRGLFTMYLGREWRTAEPHFRAAVAGNERSSLAQAYMGLFLAAAGRQTEAAAYIERATLLDPFSPIIHGLAAIAWYVADHAQMAAEMARRALDLQPGYLLGLWTLALIDYRLGDIDSGLAKAEQVVKLSGAPFFVAVLGLGYGLAGRSDDAARLLSDLYERLRRGEYVPPVALLAIHAGLQDLVEIRRDLRAFGEAACGAPTLLYTCASYLRDIAQSDPEVAQLFDLVMGADAE